MPFPAAVMFLPCVGVILCHVLSFLFDIFVSVFVSLLCHCCVIVLSFFVHFFVILGVILESDVILELFRNLALCSEMTKKTQK